MKNNYKLWEGGRSIKCPFTKKNSMTNGISKIFIPHKSTQSHMHHNNFFFKTQKEITHIFRKTHKKDKKYNVRAYF